MASQFSAALFDVDGVQVNTLLLLRDATILTFKEFGYEITEEEFNRHKREPKVYESIVAERGLAIDKKAFQGRRWEQLQKIVRERGIQKTQGIEELLQRLKRSMPGIRLCSVSNNYAEVIELFHTQTGLGRYFEIKVTGENLEKKPAPDLYSSAIRRLGVDPMACFAVEDTSKGVLSAMRAGIPAVIALSSVRKEDTIKGVYTVKTLDDVTMEFLEEIRQKADQQYPL